MSLHRRLAVATLVAAPLSVDAVSAHAAPARAASIERTLFTWTGRVDREVYITIRGRDVRTSGQDANLPNRARVDDALPRAGRGYVLVRLADGRGDVDVVDQPSARNNYQATVRVRDPRAGADNYRVIAYWSGDDRNDGRYDDRRDRDNNGWGWGRDDRDRDNRDRDNRNDNRGRDDDRWDNRGRTDAGMLRWTGRVDDVVELRISGRRVEAITRSGVRVSETNARFDGAGLPARPMSLNVDQYNGRGHVELVQQPSPWNGWTAVVRINDNRAGADFYDLTVRW
jgi:hypothetical protein